LVVAAGSLEVLRLRRTPDGSDEDAREEPRAEDEHPTRIVEPRLNGRLETGPKTQSLRKSDASVI
jgi:hypothetical protein